MTWLPPYSGFISCSSFTRKLPSACSDAFWLFKYACCVMPHCLPTHWNLSVECPLTTPFLMLVNLALPSPPQLHRTTVLSTLSPIQCSYCLLGPKPAFWGQRPFLCGLCIPSTSQNTVYNRHEINVTFRYVYGEPEHSGMERYGVRMDTLG